MDVADQEAIDRTLCRLDGTPDKHRLGGNALFGRLSGRRQSRCRFHQSTGLPLSGSKDIRPALPDILATVIAGGVFSTSGMEFEDYMAVFHGFSSFPEELDALCELRFSLEKALRGRYRGFPRRTEALWPLLRLLP